MLIDDLNNENCAFNGPIAVERDRVGGPDGWWDRVKAYLSQDCYGGCWGCRVVVAVVGVDTVAVLDVDAVVVVLSRCCVCHDVEVHIVAAIVGYVLSCSCSCRVVAVVVALVVLAAYVSVSSRRT